MSSENIEEIKTEIKGLTDKVDQLSTKLNNIEAILRNKVKIRDPSLMEEDLVVIAENLGREDQLIPQDLFLTPDKGIRKTVSNLLMLRLASADEIAKVTHRERAVESAYLNDLEKKSKCRKIRIGRRTYFYISNRLYLEPFQNLNKSWRDAFILILKTYDLDQDEIQLKISELVSSFKKSDVVQSQKLTYDSDIESKISNDLENIAKYSNIITKDIDSFIIHTKEWIKIKG